MRPLPKYLQMNSAVCRHATTSMKSVLFSPESRFLKSRSTARVKLVTETPDCVVRSSGSRTRRPIMIMRFSIFRLLPLLALADDHGAQNAVGDAQNTVQLLGEIGIAGEGHEDIVPLRLVIDGVGQPALAPLLNLHDRAVLLGQRLKLLDGGGNSLLAQRGIDDIHDFVISVNLCHGLHLLLDEWPPLSGGSKDSPQNASPIIIPVSREMSRRFSGFFGYFLGEIVPFRISKTFR